MKESFQRRHGTQSWSWGKGEESEMSLMKYPGKYQILKYNVFSEWTGHYDHKYSEGKWYRKNGRKEGSLSGQSGQLQR